MFKLISGSADYRVVCARRDFVYYRIQYAEHGKGNYRDCNYQRKVVQVEEPQQLPDEGKRE